METKSIKGRYHEGVEVSDSEPGSDSDSESDSDSGSGSASDSYEESYDGEVEDDVSDSGTVDYGDLDLEQEDGMDEEW